MIKAGLYIHIPFCKIKCIYCDFQEMFHDVYRFDPASTHPRPNLDQSIKRRRDQIHIFFTGYMPFQKFFFQIHSS